MSSNEECTTWTKDRLVAQVGSLAGLLLGHRRFTHLELSVLESRHFD